MSQATEEEFTSSVTQPIIHQIDDGYEEDPLDLLDYDVEPEEVIQRIEHITSWFLETVSSGMLPDLVLENPTSVSLQNPSKNNNLSTQQNKVVSLVGNYVESADRYARMWTILDHCHENLMNSIQTTQRDFHYRFKPQEIFSSQRQLAEAIEDVVLLLKVPRHALGITCSSKGLVYGPLSIFDSSANCTTHCMPSQQQISGDINKIKSLTFSTSARFVLIVEKDTVFQKLTSDPVFMHNTDIILITGKGVPCLATRVFISYLHQACPHLVLLGFVDWNPSGVLILNIYKHGSSRMVESRRYALPSLQWLGLHSTSVSMLGADVIQSLTDRDVALISTLQESLQKQHQYAWIHELTVMQQSKSKCDIEALYSSPGLENDGSSGNLLVNSSLGHFIQSLIDQQSWI